MRKRRVKLLNNKYIICTMWNKMKLAAQIRIALRREREKMALPNRMSLRPDLLWLNLNLALIIQCLSRNNIYFFNFTYPLRCLRVPPGVHVPQVEYHWPRESRLRAGQPKTYSSISDGGKRFFVPPKSPNRL
jgi:hypothetical protein